MDNKQFILMARYNQWMNDRLYATCSKIADADRKKDRGAFFKSIHGTLNHILVGDLIWMGRFTGKPLSGIRLSDELYSDYDELWSVRKGKDQDILDWVPTLEEVWLDTDFEFTSQSDGKTRVRPVWLLLTHMFNHQTHHRGQVTTLMKQLGVDPGVTDMPWMERE